MANNENLKPFKKGQISREVAARNGSLGGIAKRDNERVRKAIELIVDGKAPAQLQDILKKLGIKNPKKMTYIESLLRYANLKAISKNAKLSDIIKLLEFMRDGLGEMPTQKVEVSSNEQIKHGLDKLNELL